MRPRLIAKPCIAAFVIGALLLPQSAEADVPRINQTKAIEIAKRTRTRSPRRAPITT